LKIKELQTRMQALAEGVQEPQNPQELDQALRVEQTLITMQEEVKALTEEKPKVLSIAAVEHYTKYSFIPNTRSFPHLMVGSMTWGLVRC